MADCKEKLERLFSLDLLRGIDMFYLACGGALIPALLKWQDAPPTYARFLQSHPWQGFTLYDLIMPLFIFMCGAAIPFSLGRRLGPDSKPGTGYWRHVWCRVALLWVLGMLAQGNLASLNIHKIAIYSNALQTIAVGYLAAALLLPIRRISVKVAIALALLTAYGLIVHFGGDYTKDGNISQKIDLAIWGLLLPDDSTAVENIRTNGYSWILPSMTIILLGKEVVGAVVTFFQRYYGERMRILVSRDLSLRVVERMLSFRMAFFSSEGNETGKLQSRIDRGIMSLSNTVNNFFIEIKES